MSEASEPRATGGSRSPLATSACLRDRSMSPMGLDINTDVRIIACMPKRSLREPILEAGLKVMFAKGYVGAGVRDIVAEAAAPQGSFTNHFRSKEDFAREVLDRYFDDLKRVIAETLGDGGRRPRERLRRYLDLITSR